MREEMVNYITKYLFYESIQQQQQRTQIETVAGKLSLLAFEETA